MTLKHATLTCLVVYCVICYWEEALQPCIPNPQSAGMGVVAGWSTALGISVVIPSTGVFTHLTDFVEKANTAVHSVYTFQCQWSNLNIM